MKPKYSNRHNGTNLTKLDIFNYWKYELIKNKNMFLDDCNEYNLTEMGESAQEHFKVNTPNGDSDIESNIFDWAMDFIELIENDSVNNLIRKTFI